MWNLHIKLIVTELILRGRTLNILLLLYYTFFKMPKTIRLNATHYFIMKVPNKREIQQIASIHLSEIDFKDFMKLYKDYTKEPYSLLVNDTTLPSDNPLGFRKNVLWKWVLVRKLKQSITKWSKTKLNMI